MKYLNEGISNLSDKDYSQELTDLIERMLNEYLKRDQL